MENQLHSDQTIGGSSLIPKLQIIQGDLVGKTFTLKFKTRLGRETDNDIIVTDPKISRYHCQIAYEDGNWQLTDLGSANGTLLNGMPVTVPQSLTHGDQIALGETILAFTDPLDQDEIPLNPADTIAGGVCPPLPDRPRPVAPPMPSTGTSRLAWIAGGLVLLLILGIAALWLWQKRPADTPTPVDTTPVVVTPTSSGQVSLIRTTPIASENLVLKFEDDFSNSDSGWDDAFGKFYTKQYGNAQYHIEITTNNLVVWGLANRSAADFEAEVEATQQTADAGNTYGLIFRYVDHDNYYRFDVSPDGYFLLTRFQNAVWNTLIDWTASTAINKGETTNVLKIKTKGDQISLFANGQELAKITDDAFSAGNFGFFASTFNNPHIWVSFDNLKLWSSAEHEIALLPTAAPNKPVSPPTVQPVDLATATPASLATLQPKAAITVTTLLTTSHTISLTTPMTATATISTPAVLPDFVSRDQPLARGERALTGKLIFPQFDPARGTYDLYRANPDGSNLELLIPEASQPAAGKDGNTIAYRSWKADERGLVSQKIGAADKWRFNTYFESAGPAFSSSEQFFVFHSREGGTIPALYRTVGDDHQVLRRDGFPIQGQMVSLTPTDQMVYRGCLGNTCGLVLSNLDGSFPQQLTDFADDTSPAVSPNGKTIAFMSNRGENWNIYTIEISGQNLKQLTTDTGGDGMPAWSPDGKTVAFVSNRDGFWAIWAITDQGQQPHQLFALNQSVDGVVQLDTTNSFGWLEERLVWTQ